MFMDVCDSDDGVQILYILCGLSVCIGLLAAYATDHSRAPPVEQQQQPDLHIKDS